MALNESQWPTPLISVVCCTHNRLAFVREHWDRIRGSLTRDVELIYALDNCTDDTFAYLTKATQDTPQVRIEPYTGEGGLFKCRNFSLGIARGRYIHFLDDDDTVEQGFFSAVCADLKNPDLADTDLYITGLRVLETGAAPFSHPILTGKAETMAASDGVRLHLRGDLFELMVNGEIYCVPANALYARQLITKYRFNDAMRKSGDWLLILQVALLESLHVVVRKDVVADYAIHPSSMSVASDKPLWNVRVFDIIMTLAEGEPAKRNLVRPKCAAAHFHAGYALRLKDKSKALWHYLKAFRLGLYRPALLAALKLPLAR